MADVRRDAGPSQPKRARFGLRADVSVTNTAATPAILDVERFANTRRAEINAMENAIKASRDSGAKRAFQSLPRHLRRRAASHNIRRLPKRLRAKAMMEIMHEQTRTSNKRKFRQMPLAKRRKLLRFSRLQILHHRQRNKAWLETHIWHAKRMKMQDLWGYRLAWTPTAKAFRPSYRAAARGVIIHDCSYMQAIELKGQFKALQTILDLICDASAVSPASQRYSNGLRACTTTLHARGGWPFDLLGPADFIWNTPPLGEPDDAILRQVLIRFHPSILFSVTTAVEAAIAKFQAASPVNLPIQDRPREVSFRNVAYYHRDFCSFEITGPKSSDALRTCLRPVPTKAKNDTTQPGLSAGEAWQSLTSPASIPQGTVIGIEVYDPRLTFPPHPIKRSHFAQQRPIIPSRSLANNPRFWSASVRKSLSVPKYSKLQLDERRKQLLLPGAALRAGPTDDRVPIILIQRTLSADPQGNNTAKAGDALSGWTLIVPAGWGSAFWHSLVYADTRVGGVRERAHQDFEAGVPSFPFDWLCTTAFLNFTRKQATAAQAKWERTPTGKRINFAHLDTKSPWKADLDSIVKRQIACGSAGATGRAEDADESTVEGVDQPVRCAEATSFAPPNAVPWLVPARLLHPIIVEQGQRQPGPEAVSASQQQLRQALLSKIAHFRTKRNLSLISLQLMAQAESRAFVQVALHPVQRGKPLYNAMIYVPSHETTAALKEQLRKSGDFGLNYTARRQRHKPAVEHREDPREQGGNKRRRLADNAANGAPTNDSDNAVSGDSSGDEAVTDDHDSSLFTPVEGNLIGYVTSGNQSMARGRGMGIGAVSLLGLLNIINTERATTLHKGDTRLLVLYRNAASSMCRAASLQVIAA